MVGSYRVKTKLGEGGMGVVYVAEHPLLRKNAVVKFLHAELSSNAEIVERFFNEAKSATLIRHPGIVDVFDFGRHASGCAFILMEFLEGESLAARIAKGALPAPLGIHVARQIASALAAAHEQHIVHRDLKPDNVFLVPDADAVAGVRVKVLDFGIAKLAGEAAAGVKTQTGAVMGTPAYMAPEQCKSAARVDHRADVYALGCIMFEMICGRPPFLGNSIGQLIAAHMFEDPPALCALAPAAGQELQHVIGRALAKDPDARSASMSILSAELAACAPARAALGNLWEGLAKPGRERMRSQPSAAPVDAVAATVPPTVPPTLPPTGMEFAAAGIPSARPPAGPVPAVMKPITTLSGSLGEVRPDPRPARGASRWLAGGAIVAVAAVIGITAWRHEAADVAPKALPPSVPVPASTASDVPVSTPGPVDAIPQVTLKLDSTPQGAEVIQEQLGVVVGRTPYARTIAPIAGGTVSYVIRLRGFEDAQLELPTDRDQSRTVALKATRPMTSSATRGGGTHTPRVGASVPKEKSSAPTAPATTHAVGPSSDGMLSPNL